MHVHDPRLARLDGLGHAPLVLFSFVHVLHCLAVRPPARRMTYVFSGVFDYLPSGYFPT